ncbi:hypothetical protein BMS3Abin17_00624 [archaeon BMS3Abin17]|nr:hypothetical protein BMS3Abin17_00624 [archaeon BMS3Abin17]HDZ60183.1 hypothetical protein [Candidatus Pacearchaeota archaeon]
MTYYIPDGRIGFLHACIWVMIAILPVTFMMCLVYNNKKFDGSAFGLYGYYLVKGIRSLLK